MYCKTCKKYFCRTCVKDFTEEHKINHYIIDLTNMMPTNKDIDSLNDIFESSLKKYEKLIDSIENWKNYIINKSDELKSF